MPKQVGSSWSFDQIGAYWGAAVWWVAPSQRIAIGGGLYAVNFGWGWVYLNANVAWSPIYTWVQHPVYSNTYDDYYAVWQPDRYAWTNLFTDFDLEDGAWADDDAVAYAAGVGPGAGTPNQIQLQFATGNVVVRKGPSTSYARAPAFSHNGGAITSPNYNKGQGLLALADVGSWVAVAAKVPGNSTYYARGYVPQADIKTSSPDWVKVHRWTRDLSAPSNTKHVYTVSGGYASMRNTPQGFTIGYLYAGEHFFDTRGGPQGTKQYLNGWASGGAQVNSWMPFCKVSGGGKCKAYVP